MNKKYLICFVTTSNLDEANKIAKALVSKKLAACVNIIDPIKSIYTWKKKLCEDKECLLIIKTKQILANKLKKEIKKLHSYEVPEIIALEIKNGLKSYLDWIDEVLDRA
jgi:periplasmic divalent cation tolerance protein